MSEIYMPTHVILKEFMTHDLCDDLVANCEKEEQHLAKLNNAANYLTILQKRYSYISFHEEPEFLNELHSKVTDINTNTYKFHINIPKYFQYTTYKEKGFFDWHCDLIMDSHTQERDVQMRKLSLIILLNDEFEGGEFLVSKGSAKEIHVPLKKGDAVLIPSFIQHKVYPIVVGERKSLVVWFTGDRFR